MSAKANETRKLQYRRVLEKGMVISLLFCVILFQGSKRIVHGTRAIIPDIPGLSQVDAVATRQNTRQKVILKPTVPMPSEKEDIFGPEICPTFNDPSWVMEPPPPPQISDEPHFIRVEKEARPVGGFQEILKYLEYPDLAKQAGIQGRVVVWAKIDEKGDVVRTQIRQSLGFEPCDRNAMKAVQAVKWEPALQRDQPVSVWVSIPIDFKLR